MISIFFFIIAIQKLIVEQKFVLRKLAKLMTLTAAFMFLLGVSHVEGQTTQETDPPGDGSTKLEDKTCGGDFVWDGPERKVTCVCYENSDGTCDETSVSGCGPCIEITEKFVDGDVTVYNLHLPIPDVDLEITGWEKTTIQLSDGGIKNVYEYTLYQGDGG